MRPLAHDLQEALARLDESLRPLLPHHLRELDEGAADDVEDCVPHDIGLAVLGMHVRLREGRERVET